LAPRPIGGALLPASSEIVFHWWQLSHLPDHLLVTAPQLLQAKLL
jgi:hypothetical protein